MTYEYVLAPVAGYICAGIIKWLSATLRMRAVSLRPQGLGGFPSTHAATVTAPLFLMLLAGRWTEPAAGVAAALAIIVIVDSLDLRRRIGEQAAAINRLASSAGIPTQLRGRIGHTVVESLGGAAVGLACATVLAFVGG